MTYSDVNETNYCASDLLSMTKNRIKPNRMNYFSSDTEGVLSINTIIENRSLLLISPSTSFQYVVAKSKMWALAIILIVFLTTQFIWMRKNDLRQPLNTENSKIADEYKITK